MVMNKKGQYAILGVMVAVMLFILAVQFITPIKWFVTEARDADHLNCTNPAKTTGTSMTCIVTDLYLFYFFGSVVAAGLGYLFVKKIQTNIQ